MGTPVLVALIVIRDYNDPSFVNGLFMQVHTQGRLRIFFGDKTHSFLPKDYYHIPPDKLLTMHPFTYLNEVIELDAVVLLRQVHGIDGVLVVSRKHADVLQSFIQPGDFTMTAVTGIGLAVVTADCVPLIFYDRVRHIIAIAHAGWRGSVAGIASVVVGRMNREYGTDTRNLSVFIGPSAGKCCYTVDNDFRRHLEEYTFSDEVLCDNVFDMLLFNQRLLEEIGISSEDINTSYHACTICNPSYCSVRRENDSPARQLTVVVLKG